MTGINSVAYVNPVSLLATTLLATPRHSLGDKDLLEQLSLYIHLLAEGSSGADITITDKSPQEIVDYCSSLDLLEKVPNALGEIIALDTQKAVELTYFRNNVAHLFVVPSLVACCFLNQDEIEVRELHRMALAVYPFLKAELFLSWSQDKFRDVIQSSLELLSRHQLLSISEDGQSVFRAPGDSDKAGQLDLLARCLLQTLERYYIAIAVLAKNGSGSVSRGQLEKLCILTAQRISRLYEIEAPEFYDRSLFRQFINELRQLDILSNDKEGKLTFGERLESISEHTNLILRKEIRQVIVRAATQAIVEESDD